MDQSFIKSVTDSMDDAMVQLNDKTGPTAEAGNSFDPATFKTALCLCSKKLSAEVTKLSLIFSKDPLPSPIEAKDLVQGIDAAFVDTLATFYALPNDAGESMYKMFHEAVLKVLNSVVTVLKSLGNTGAQAQKDRLTLTGLTWEACEATESLPENNLRAVCKTVKETEDLVADALQEIEEEVSNSLSHGDDTSDESIAWSQLDQVLLPPCVGLVKTARSCLKKVSHALKTQGMCDTAAHVRELDKIALAVAPLSPSIDDFIASIYPPMNRVQVQTEASVIVCHVGIVLKISRESHYITDDDQLWIDFLYKAVNHNYNKLQLLLNPDSVISV